MSLIDSFINIQLERDMTLLALINILHRTNLRDFNAALFNVRRNRVNELKEWIETTFHDDRMGCYLANQWSIIGSREDSRINLLLFINFIHPEFAAQLEEYKGGNKMIRCSKLQTGSWNGRECDKEPGKFLNSLSECESERGRRQSDATLTFSWVKELKISF